MTTRDALARARAARTAVGLLTAAERDDVLRACADALVAATDPITRANADDLARGRAAGLPDNLLDRLLLDRDRVAAIAQAMREVADLPDPLGVVRRETTRPNGLRLREVTVPFGVIGMVYEARPNVTADAFAIAFKCGSACVLRGGSAALSSARAIVDVVRATLAGRGIPADAVVLLDGGDRAEVTELLTARGLVDLVIPRGSAELIRTVVDTATVPVIETGAGNCHVYVDAAADLDMALAVAVNAKTSRTSVCNSAETLLVHADVAAAFLPRLCAALATEGVVVHADERALPVALTAGCDATPATDADWATEYLAMEVALGVVDSLGDALAHVAHYSTGHTEAIVTADPAAAERWRREVDAAAVVVNASTRFTDGGEFGFGAEIGISTQKLHARGPMGLAELVSTKWLVDGDGQVR